MTTSPTQEPKGVEGVTNHQQQDEEPSQPTNEGEPDAHIS